MGILRRLRRKRDREEAKKNKLKVKLYLEKDGIERVVDINMSSGIIGLMRLARKLGKYIKDKWNLIKAEGENKEFVDWLNGLISQYNNDPKNFEISQKECFKQALNIIRSKKE